MELGWRGQRAWERELGRLQYQALRKATDAVQGTATDKMNRMAGVEDVRTHMDNSQVQFMAWCVEDPSKMGDIMPAGFGDSSILDECKKDGFISTLTRAIGLLPEGRPLWGGPCLKVDIKEVDVKPSGAKSSEQDPNDPGGWETEIQKAGAGVAYIYSDGSPLESGVVGGGAYVVGTMGMESEAE